MRKLLTFLIALAAISMAYLPASAQVGGLMFPGPGSFAASGGGYTGPADAIAANLLGCWSLRACTAAYRGSKVANVCNITGAVNNGCADMLSDATTGNLVSKTIAGITCPGANCAVNILYFQTGSAACTSSCDLAVSGFVTVNAATLGTSCGSLSKAFCMTFTPSPNNQYYISGTINSTVNQPITLATVAMQTGTLTTNNGIVAAGSAGAGAELAWHAAATAQAFLYAGSASVGDTAQTVNAWHSFQGIFSGSSSYVDVDGTPGTTANPGSNGMTTSSVFKMGASAFNEAM